MKGSNETSGKLSRLWLSCGQLRSHTRAHAVFALAGFAVASPAFAQTGCGDPVTEPTPCDNFSYVSLVIVS